LNNNECCKPEKIPSDDHAYCGDKSKTEDDSSKAWLIGEIQTAKGSVPQISTQLLFCDKMGSLKARWGVNRMHYTIDPGLYAVGAPGEDSPILVTANYKLTFDKLRKELGRVNVWILVLDTKGINVWCAAGKGTFGTKELITRIRNTNMHEIVTNRILIIPQLGATGVSAAQVAKITGFKVIFGPVRAKDIKEFIDCGMIATNQMRTVRFNTYDRLVLTPMELVGTFKTSLMIFGVLFILNLLHIGSFGFIDFYAYIGALITGCVLTPVLLPLIPGRAFAWKGLLLGLIWAIIVNILNGWPDTPSYSLLRALGYLLILPSISGFLAMNFTGSSTYTSLSGVVKEMKIAVPTFIISISLGCILILVNSFVNL